MILNTYLLIVFRHKNYLFILECKGTSEHFSEEKEYVKWNRNLEKQVKKLDSKIELMGYFIENNLLYDNYFNGLEKHLSFIIKTEGIYDQYRVMPLDKFELFLKKTRKLIDKGDFETFFD